MKELIAKENIEKAAWVKRFMELMSLVPGVALEYAQDNQKMLDDYGIPLTPSDVKFKKRKPGGKMEAVYPDSAAGIYADFMNNKLDMRDEIREQCIPSDKAFRKWRDRQIGRCTMQLGAKFESLIHAPLLFELADGCSMGCEFCGLNAGKLKSVFRYTDENAELFRAVLKSSKEIIGHAAGMGTLYFATEPLDNPDYELFLKDYVDCFDEIPQITTAASFRHLERLRPLLHQINERRNVVYRFSVLSLDILLKIYETFSPEELLFVELLPQFKEAPSNNFVNAGRNGSVDEYGDTISCASGFVVNMCRKEIKLTTPTWADNEHPTGEIILFRGNFTDEKSFTETIKECISKYMGAVAGPKDTFEVPEYVKSEMTEKGYRIYCDKGSQYTFEAKSEDNPYKAVMDVLVGKKMTRSEIVEAVKSKNELKNTYYDGLFYLINKMWSLGMISTDKLI